MKKLGLLMILFLVNAGCVAAAIGVAATSTSKRTKSKWTAEFNRNNTERETKGLKPLDWCDEAFKVNKGWATKDAECKAKLEAQGKI